MRRFPNQLVEFRHSFTDFRPQLLVLSTRLSLTGSERLLDSVESLVSTIQSCVEGAVVHRNIATHNGEASQALTVNGSPDKGTATSRQSLWPSQPRPRSLDAADPTPPC